MNDLLKICHKLHLNSDDLFMEAECIEEYGSWLHMELMEYSPDELREAAEQL